jgi:hypothetical protein
MSGPISRPRSGCCPPVERDVLRDVIAARLAADYLEALGVLDEQERAA